MTFALLEGLNKAKRDDDGKTSERAWMNYAVEQALLMQIEDIKKRSIENKQVGGQGRRGVELVFVAGDNGTARFL